MYAPCPRLFNVHLWAQCAPGPHHAGDHAGKVQPGVMFAVLPGAVALYPAIGAVIHCDLGPARGISGRSVPLPLLGSATSSAVNVKRA